MEIDVGLRKVVKILIQEPVGVPVDEVIIVPTIHARLITENGTIFDASFHAFRLTEDDVVKSYAENPDCWVRYDPNKRASAQP